jgi:murein DD-endopeptidase MepM/ murein hydrolase activator NlpD
MVKFLELASDNPDRIAVALHEYSYSEDIWHGRTGEPDSYEYWKVGRFTRLFDVCDDLGIARPTTLITEWGWHATSIPKDERKALRAIAEVGVLYDLYPEVKMAGLWYLGGGYSGISSSAQGLIAPVGVMALEWEDLKPPEPPGPGETDEQRWWDMTVEEQITCGIQLADTAIQDAIRRDGFHPVTKEMYEEGEPPMMAAEDWITGVEPRRVYVWQDGHVHWFNEPEPEPVPEFKFDALPTEYPVITQEFGNNPDYYGQFGLPGHEGLDFRAPGGSQVFAVAPGVVVESIAHNDGHNYGYRVRIDHEHGYQTTYAHLQGTAVDKGVYVEAGDVIGLADSTGNATGSHLHITLKSELAYEGGPHYIGYPYNIIDPTPAVEHWLGRKYDLAEYMTMAFDRGILYEVQTYGAGQERHQTHVEGDVFYHTKGGDGPNHPAQWEQLKSDHEYIYRFTDTSPGQGKYYQLRDVPDQPWSKWAPRFMSAGQVYTRNPQVTFYHKSNCEIRVSVKVGGCI